jgi:hypothetical protein
MLPPLGGAEGTITLFSLPSPNQGSTSKLGYDFFDPSRQIASSASKIPLLDTSDFALALDQLDVSSLAASLTLPEDSPTPRLLSLVPINPSATKQTFVHEVLK